MTSIYGALGVSPTNRGQPTITWTLAKAQRRLIPAGTWLVSLGLYTVIQEYDPVTTIWRPLNASYGTPFYMNSDGVNYCVANPTGCVVGAVVTTGGTLYTSAPTVTASAGSATFVAVVGGAVNTTVTVANGGTGYTYPPQIAFDSPPGVGVQASGYAAISGGAITSITVSNQGAGYTNAPNISIINDPRDTTGTNGSATCTLTGSGTVTAVLVTNHGNSVADATTAVPTLTFAGGGGSGAAATAIMFWTIQAYTVTTAGSGFSGVVGITAVNGGLSATGTYTNPAVQSGLVRTRMPIIQAAVSSAALTATGQTVFDGGILTGLATGLVTGFTAGSSTSAAPAVGFSYGGAIDTVLLQPV